MSNSVQPHRRQPTRLPHPWDSPGKNTGVGCHFLLPCMKVKSESEVAQSCLTLRNPMDCSPPGFSVHGIFQTYREAYDKKQESSIYCILHVPTFKSFLPWKKWLSTLQLFLLWILIFRSFLYIAKWYACSSISCFINFRNLFPVFCCGNRELNSPCHPHIPI